MAAHVDGNRQAGNVGRVGDDIDSQRSDRAAHILRTDAQTVDAVEDLAFHIGVVQLAVVGEQITAQCLLGKQRTHLGIAADAHADNQRCAGFAAVFLDAVDHEGDDVLAGGAGMEHLHGAGVFAAGTLRDDGQSDAVALYQAGMDDGRSVVLRVDAVERIIDHRFAQIGLGVSLTDTLVDRILKQLSDDVDVLTDLGKDNDHAGVLTDRDVGVLGELVVFNDAVDGALAVRRNLVVIRGIQRQLDVRRQKLVCTQTKVFDGAGDGF